MTSSSFRQIRDFLLLLLWGAFVLRLAATGQLSTYLHPSLQPYTVAAGIILIILALFALRGILGKKEHHDHSCCHGHPQEELQNEEHTHSVHEGHSHDDHAHHHTHGEECSHHEQSACTLGHEGEHQDHTHEKVAREEDAHEHHTEVGAGLPSLIFKTLLLLLPLGVILFGQANHYSLSTVQNRGVVQDLSKLPAAKASTMAAASGDSTSDQQGTTDGGVMKAEVIDLLYAVQMPSYREDFEGKQVQMVGQFVPLTTGNPKGDRFQLIRLFITCCAADAKPVGVTVEYDKPLKVSEMGWLKIVGTPTFPMEGGRRTAVLVASKIEPCPAPDEPFVY